MQTSTPSRTPSPAPNVFQNPLSQAFATPSPLTIQRHTATHHGRALQALRHAAENLADSRAASIEDLDTAAHQEAIHILMRLSGDVFRDYAASTRRPVTDWIMSKGAA